jgi:hypothetical protein
MPLDRHLKGRYGWPLQACSAAPKDYLQIERE